MSANPRQHSLQVVLGKLPPVHHSTQTGWGEPAPPDYALIHPAGIFGSYASRKEFIGMQYAAVIQASAGQDLAELAELEHNGW